MIKLGVLDSSIVDAKENVKEYTETDDLVQVALGNAKPVFNNLNNSKDYYLFTRGLSGLIGTSIINEENNVNHNQILYLNEGKTSHNTQKVDNKDKVKLELFKFYNPKGPPIRC